MLSVGKIAKKNNFYCQKYTPTDCFFGEFALKKSWKMRIII